MDDDIFLGVDAGGTKTDACICDASGRVLGFGVAAGGNWETVGLDGVEIALRRAVNAALIDAGRSADSVRASVFALAGMDWPGDREPLLRVVGRLGLSGAAEVVNDAFAALRAGSAQGTGIVSIAGTGGLTAGRSSNGEVFRTMGMNIGEAGGSHSILLGALSALAQARNGHRVDTVLWERFVKGADVASVDAMFEGIARGDTAVGNDFARLVLAAAADGDPVSISIVEREGERHGEDVVAVARTLGLDQQRVTVVRAGGVHVNANRHFDSAFAAAVSAGIPNAELTRLTVPPVSGALLLALESDGRSRATLTARVGSGVAMLHDVRRSVVTS